MPQSLTEVLDNLYTTTWKEIKDSLTDNIFTSTPFFAMMQKAGRIMDQAGGRQIEFPVSYAKNDRGAWLVKGSTMDMNDQEFMTESYWTWKYYAVPIVRFGTDDQKNRGKMQILNYVQEKIDNAKDTIEDAFETQLFAASATANAFEGLQTLVADDPTAAVTVGGIPQNTETWWQNKKDTLASTSFATSGVDKMRSMVNTLATNKRMNRPDFIMCGQDPFEYYEDAVLGKFQFENKDLADLGFESLTFKGIPLSWSPSCGDRMYFLNTRFLKLVKDPGLFMDMTEWKAIPNQVNDRVAQIVSAITLVTNRRRVQGVIFSVDTP